MSGVPPERAPMPAQESWRFVVTGRVQGVGFRWFVRERARRLALRGWVRNQPNGSVEVVVAGSPEEVERLKKALAVGPEGSSVEGVIEAGEAGDNPLPFPFAILK